MELTSTISPIRQTSTGTDPMQYRVVIEGAGSEDMCRLVQENMRVGACSCDALRQENEALKKQVRELKLALESDYR